MKTYVINKFNTTTSQFETIQSTTTRISEIILVTPAIATTMLENNNHNRPASQKSVSRYKRDMITNKWQISNDALVFANNKDVLNGQNRLWAIVESNTSQYFNVIFGGTREDQAIMDEGTNRRRLHDVAVLSGVRIGKFASQVGRYIRRQTIQFIPRQATRAEEVQFLVDHKPMLDWVESILRPANIKRNERSATVVMGNDVASAFARAFAYYANDPAKQQRVELMAKGFVWQNVNSELMAKRNDGDGAFYTLARKLETLRDHQGQRGRNEKYAYAEKAILQFVNNESKELRISQEELFPLRTEIEAKIMQKANNIKIANEKTEVKNNVEIIEEIIS